MGLTKLKAPQDLYNSRGRKTTYYCEVYLMTNGQGLSMTVIILAAIALLVLVIISVLVLRAGGNVNDNTGCTGVGGQCVEGNPLLDNPCGDLTPQGDWQYSAAHNCNTEGQICCIRI